jgi:predicted CoA-substrate-specific enzyme activase
LLAKEWLIVRIGLDIGSSSAKLAALVSSDESNSLARFFASSTTFRLAPVVPAGQAGTAIVISQYRRAIGSPLHAALDLLEEFREAVGDSTIDGIRVTGAGGRHAAETLGARYENEFKAIARGMSAVYPQVRTIFEMAGESSKYLLLDTPNGNGHGSADAQQLSPTGILDYSTSGECAAGTGSFIDQQASRLQHRVEDIGAVVAKAKSAARIAGRCSVFAKSDMIHAQQKGYGTDQVLKGLCEAVARNFKSNIVKGKKVVAPVAFIGGVSQNSGVVQALADAFKLSLSDILVPELYAWLGAIGAALLESGTQPRHTAGSADSRPTDAERLASAPVSDSSEPLSLRNVLLLRDHPDASRTEPLPELGGKKLPVYLGIDIGSVSTNLVLLDEAGRLLHGIYLRTVGRPIEVVDQGLKEIDQLFGSRIEVRGVGTTGSGRELIGELVGADTVNDEITAHKTGAMYVHEKLVRKCGASPTGGDSTISAIEDVDTIFEIGGQDSKYISIDHGVVVDFAMNEACAAGTGSFLEEQAERLGIQIKDEFARLALSSVAPTRLGERCTVFMERDVTSTMQRGARVEDVVAGLAFSVALNYLNRVVRGRKVGNVIYFQGGTAYNDAVAAAFSMILGKRIIVPPHNGIIGAIGMALIAREVVDAKAEIQALNREELRMSDETPESSISTFRGFDLSRARFETREFVCKACSNYCDMKEITIDGEKTYWGDKCSDKFRKRARTSRKPAIDDLLAFRDRILFEGEPEPAPGRNGRHATRGLRVGVPQAMFFYDRFPFWRTYLRELGFEVVVSDSTDRYIAARGAELSVAEPCFPVQIAHGHVQSLLAGKPDRPPVNYVLLPNVVDMEAPPSPIPSQLCPWNQTLPFVVRAAPELCESSDKFLAPTVYFRLGREHVKRQLAASLLHLGVGRRDSDSAADAAFEAQARFSTQMLDAGRKAVAVLEQTGEPAVLLVGRPYNMYDRSSNCDIPRKLRDLYGVNVLPLDFLPLDETPVEDLHPNMFWNSGRRILAAGRYASSRPNLHIVYITNFKCGPDSFIKHYLRNVAGSPFLVLQFDGHGNDAGYLTRCEAYLDSKGILRCSSAN